MLTALSLYHCSVGSCLKSFTNSSDTTEKCVLVIRVSQTNQSLSAFVCLHVAYTLVQAYVCICNFSHHEDNKYVYCCFFFAGVT